MTITDVTNSQAPEPEDDEVQQSAIRRAFNRWFRREDPSVEEAVETALTPYVPEPREELEPLDWVERHKLVIPDRRRVVARVKYVGPHLPGMMLKWLFKTLPRTAWHEGVTPIWRGCGKCFTAYHNFITVKHLADAYTTAEGVQKSKHAANRSKSNMYRIWSTVFGACTAAGSMTWLYFNHFVPFLIVLGVLLLLLDVLGRQGQEKKEIVPIVLKPLGEGMDYADLSTMIQNGLNETIGLADDGKPKALISGLASYDFDRGEYRQLINTFQDFKEEHIRYLERRVAAKPGSMVILQDPRVSTQRIMVIKHRDPFANVPIAPYIPPMTRSITEGGTLGVSQTDHPFLIHLAGLHVGVVAQSAGGKSEGVIASIIEAILATRNAVCVGIDLTAGPLFPIYGKCIQKVAYTPEEAEKLLAWLLDEKERRARILQRIAESDDPNEKGREWNADLAERYNAPSIHAIVDELALATKYDGTPKMKFDLRGPLEEIARTGSKHWITLVTGQQKTGNSDSGSTGVSNNMHVWLVGPCSMADANEIFSPEQRKSGWTPHLLKSAERGKSANDAGRVFVKAPGYGPDVYCSYRPMPEEELKRRRKMRLEAGIPILKHCGEDSSNEEIMDAEVVPSRPVLEALAAAFNHFDPPDDRLPSALAAEWITERTDMTFSADSLAAALKKELSDQAPRTTDGRCKIVGNVGRKHYLRPDINTLMGTS